MYMGGKLVYVCMSTTCNNYVSATMFLGGSHIFRSNVFMKANTVAVDKKICNILFK